MLNEKGTTDLIPSHQRLVGSTTIPTVDGRDLHAFLEVTKDYSSWVKAQIKRARLIEHRDYEVFTQEGENPKGGRPSLDYAFSFEAGKHIGMLSNTARGFQIREYFLECERKMKHHDASMQVKDPRLQMIIDLAVALDAHEHRLQAQEHRLDTAEAKAEAAANMAAVALDAQQWITIRQYVYKYGLDRQLPREQASRYGRYLTRYCRTKGIPVYDKPSPVFGHENEYPENIIRTTLPRWFARRSAQGDF